MKFLERTQPLKTLKALQQKAEEQAQMAVVCGRKGTGKTTLVLQATKEEPTIYFYVSRRAESMLAADLIAEANKVLGLHLNEDIIELRTIFKQLFAESYTRRFNLIIDEFQELNVVNPQLAADLGTIWDRNRERSRMCLLLVGSQQVAMQKLLCQPHAPLLNRFDLWLDLGPYTLKTLRSLLAKHLPGYTTSDLLTFYGFTGGNPQLVAELIEAGALKRKDLIRFVFRKDSPYFHRGKSLIIDEVGKEYTFYFSIMACIAQGITSRSIIEEILNKEIGGYLTRMENDFNLIRKRAALFSKSGSKNVRYTIDDLFLKSWFRYVYPYQRLLETGRLKELERLVTDDYDSFAAETLHAYFHQQAEESKQYDILGGWWDNNTNLQIDFIALNSDSHTGTVAQIVPKTSPDVEQYFADTRSLIAANFEGFDIDYRILTINDIAL